MDASTSLVPASLQVHDSRNYSTSSGWGLRSVVKTLALGALALSSLNGAADGAPINFTCEDLKTAVVQDRMRYNGYYVFSSNVFQDNWLRTVPTHVASEDCMEYLHGKKEFENGFNPHEDWYQVPNPYDKPEGFEPVVIRVGERPLAGLEKDLVKEVGYLPLFSGHDLIGDYRFPNEAYPEQGAAAFDMVTPGGVLVSTGTERGLFNLALAEEGLFSSLVVRDINPQIKAYVDYNVLLLRMAESMEDYEALSRKVTAEDISQGTVRSITREEIKKAYIPEELKTYYLYNFDRLKREYESVSIDWTKYREFNKVNYKQNEEQFWKLKKLADSGSIVATVGDITNLDFLKEQRVSMVDTSNIWYYSPRMRFESKEGFHPVIAYTCVDHQIPNTPQIYFTSFYKYVLDKDHPENDRTTSEFHAFAMRVRDRMSW